MLFFDDRSTEKLGVCYGGYAYTAEELAEVFGELTKESIKAGKPVDYIEEQARFAARLAALALQRRDDAASPDERRRQHREEVDRAFATFGRLWGTK